MNSPFQLKGLVSPHFSGVSLTALYTLAIVSNQLQTSLHCPLNSDISCALTDEETNKNACAARIGYIGYYGFWICATFCCGVLGSPKENLLVLFEAYRGAVLETCKWSRLNQLNAIRGNVQIVTLEVPKPRGNVLCIFVRGRLQGASICLNRPQRYGGNNAWQDLVIQQVSR